MWFSKKSKDTSRAGSFGFLKERQHYFDSACQTLRPQEVLDAEMAYYTEYNACGGRVQYAWGERVDAEVEETRKAVLKHFGLSPKEYLVAFTLNTTYAVNLVMLQLRRQKETQVVTTEIEHNSVFLPSIRMAERWGLPRLVLPREEQGSVDVSLLPEEPVFFCANVTSNIDGRHMMNAQDAVAHVRKHGGLSLVDAAQTAAHKPELIHAAQPDIVVASGHKMYAPSLGILLIRKSLLERFDWQITGGGMVADVAGEEVTFLPTGKPGAEALFEPGLQQWAGIIGLRHALSWMSQNQENPDLAARLHEELRSIEGLQFVHNEVTSIATFHTDKMHAHILAKTLSAQGIMCRSGYFCCHHYLKHLRNLPPLLRVSLGRHNTMADITALAETLRSILRYL